VNFVPGQEAVGEVVELFTHLIDVVELVVIDVPREVLSPHLDPTFAVEGESVFELGPLGSGES
jgi:hypothetical protein